MILNCMVCSKGVDIDKRGSVPSGYLRLTWEQRRQDRKSFARDAFVCSPDCARQQLSDWIKEMEQKWGWTQ